MSDSFFDSINRELEIQRKQHGDAPVASVSPKAKFGDGALRFINVEPAAPTPAKSKFSDGALRFVDPAPPSYAIPTTRPMAGVQDQSLRHPPTPTADLPRGEPAPVAAQTAAPVPQPTPAPKTAPIPAPEPVPGEEPTLTAEQIAQTMPLPGISPVFGEVKPGEEFARQARGYPRLDTSTLPTYTPPPERKTIIEGVTHGLSQAGLGMNRGAAGLAKLVGENVLAMSKAMGFEDSKGARQLVDWGNQVNDWVKRYQAEHPEEQMALKPGENYLYSIGESIAKPENLVQGLVQTIPLILGGIVAGKVGGAVAGTIGAGGKAIPYAARVLGLGSQVAGETYADARAAGTDVPGATVQAILTGLGEGAIEEFTLGRKIDIFKGATGQLIKGAAEKTLVETMARSFLRGTAEEATQGINQRFWNWVFTDRSQDVLAGVGQEAALGGLLESVMSGGAVVGGKAYGQMISPQQQVQIIDDLDAVLEQSPNLNPAQKAEIKQELGRVRDAAEKGEFKEPQPLVPPEAQAGAGPTALEEARATAQPGAVPLTPEGKVETKVEGAATEVAPAPGTRVQETAAPAPAPVPGAVVPEKGAERVAPAPVTGQPATGEEAKPTYGEIISSAERADIERQLKAAPLGKRGIEVSKLRQEGETADQFATKLSRYFIRAAEENDLPAATKGLADLPALDNSIDYEIQAKFKSPKIKPAAPLKIAESHAATDNTQYILGGVYLDAKKGMYVSTDGRRLLMLPAKETIQGESRTVAIRDMKDLGKKAGETIDGRFPNWEQVIPKYNKSNSVTLPIEPEAVIPNLMTAAQLSKKLGKTKMVMAHIAGEGFSVTINPQFALDAIRALAQSGGSRITVTMAADPEKAGPVVFEAENGAKAIVMPMKTEDGYYNKGQPRGLRTVIAAVKGEPSTTLTPAVAQPGASQGAVQAAPPAPAPEGEKAGEVAPAKEPWQMTRGEFSTKPIIRIVGEDLPDTFLHGTASKNIKSLADRTRPVASLKSGSGNEIVDLMFGKESNEFGAEMLLAEFRQPQQANLFASGKGNALAVINVKKGTRVLDLSDEASRAPKISFGNEPSILRFFKRPSITDDLTNWYLSKVSDGYKERNPNWKQDTTARFDPTSPSFDVSSWRENLVRYAKDKGYGLIRFADETLVVDRGVISSARKATQKEISDASEAKSYPGSKIAGLFTDKPTGAAEESHRFAIQQALSKGKPVPPEVLKDYPELASKGEKAGEVAPAKEPWQMTREEFAKSVGYDPMDLPIKPLDHNEARKWPITREVDIAREDAVKKALAAGKPVPPEVLKDYPELAKKTKSATPEGMRRRPITEKDEVSFSGQLSKLIEKARAKGEHRYIFPTAYGLRMEFKPPPGKLQYYEIFPDGSIDYVDRVPPVFGSATQSVAAPDAPPPAKPVASKDDIPADLAEQAHRGTSFDPEKRGSAVREEYVEQINAVRDEFMAKAKTDAQKALVEAEIERYRQGYVQRLRAKLAADSRTMSSMVTGPANFPTARNAKRLDAAHKRLNELIDFDKRAQAAISRKLKELQVEEAGGEVAVLKSKIEKRKKVQEQMKAINKILRSSGLSSDEQKVERLVKGAGLTEETARKMIGPDFAGRTGFTYQLQNNLANIKRMEQRVVELEKREANPTIETTFDGGKVIDNQEADRIQIVFDQKPDAAMIGKLKMNGFRWAPSDRAWQRKRTDNGRLATERMLGIKLGRTETAAAVPPPPVNALPAQPPVPRGVAAPDALAAEKAALQKQASTLTGAAKIQREYRKLTGEKQAPLNDAIAHIARVRAVEKLGIAPATASAGAAVPPAKPPAAPPAAVPAPEGPSAPGERPSAKGELTGAEALAAIPETIKNAAGETVKLAEVFADIVGKAKDPTGTLSEEVAKVVVGKLNDPRFLANPGQYISTVAANTAKDLSAKTAERQAATTGGKALEEEMGRQEAGAAEAIRAGAEEKVTLNQQRQKTIEDAMPKMKGNPLVRITAAAFHKALAGDLTGKSLIKEVRNAVTEIARDGYKPLGIRGGYSKTILDDAFRKAYDRVSKALREQATLSVMPRTTPGENKVADMVAKNIREVTDYNARKEESGALTLPTAKIFEKRTWSDIQNTAMRKMLDVSRTPMDLAGAVKAYAIDRIKRLREALVFYPRLREFPVYRNDLRKFMDAPTDAINQADIALFGIVGKLKHDRAGYNTFRHIVALEDLIGDAELGKPIPGGFDIAALKKELEYQQSIASPEVKEATEKHFALMKAVADDLVAREKMKPEDVKEKYFHHAVMDYQTPWGDFIGLPRRIKPPMRKYVSERKGTERMLDMDYIGVTRSHLGQVFLDNAMDDWIEKQGKSNSLESTMTPDQWKAFKQEHPPTPNGIVDVEGKRYRWFQFQPGNTFQEGKAVSQKLLADAIEANMTAAELAEMRGPQGGKAIRDALIMGGKHKMFLVPEAVYDSFKSLRQPAGDMYDIVREVIRGTALWKRMVIDLGGLPIRIPNMLSDFMKLYIHDPKAYLNVPAATKMIFKRHPAAQRAFGTELNNYEKRMQDIAHQQNVDMASVYRERSYVLNEDALYNMRHPYMRFNPLRYLAGAWEGIVMDTESIPRYAKLMTDMNRILAGQSVHASTLDGVKELAEKGFNVEAAGRAARLVTVDYREVSPTYSRWGRGLLFPFVTWFDYTARDITTNIQKTKGVGLAKFLIPYALAFMWNNTGDRRETEENLPPYLKYMFHINTGYRDKDGKAIVISMMTPYDAWGRWFGLDRIGEKITNVRAGRMTTADAVKEQALDFVKGPGRNLRSLLHPMIQTIYGLVSNKHPMFGTPIVPEDAGPDKQNKLRAQFVASAFLTPYSQLLRVSRDFEPGDAWSKFLFEGGPMDFEKAFGFRHVDTEKERQKMISAEVEQNVEPALKNIKDKVQDGFIKWQGTGDKADYEAAIKYMQGMREKGYSVPNDMFLGWIQSYRVALGVTKEKLRLAKPGSAEEKALRGDIRMLEQSAWAERLQGRSRAILPVVKDVVESYYKLGPEKLKSPESE